VIPLASCGPRPAAVCGSRGRGPVTDWHGGGMAGAAVLMAVQRSRLSGRRGGVISLPRMIPRLICDKYPNKLTEDAAMREVAKLPWPEKPSRVILGGMVTHTQPPGTLAARTSRRLRGVTPGAIANL
jgi:hypothetical protein